jgi:1,2-diacylglycerol 3-alpha-glucosyltransferase
MHVLMLSDVYFPRVNGVSTSIRTFAKVLLKLGHRVTLVAPNYGNRTDQAAVDAELGDGFEVIRLDARTIFFDPEDRLITSRALRECFALLADREWDVVHVHTPFRAHQLGVRLKRARGLRVVETYHTYFEEYAAHYLPWLPAWILKYLARAASRKLCGDVDHLIVPTEEMADVLNAYGITTPSTVLPTGVDLGEFAGGDGAAFRQAQGIEHDRPVLVTVSRLAIEKNIEFLLRAVRLLVREFPDLLFLLAGEGPDASRLKALAITLGLERNTRFFGNLDRSSALLDCYRAADVFVFASPTETQGLVLIEAMALGVPVVSTAVMGTATVLRGTRSTVTSEPEAERFAEHVARVLRQPQLRTALSEAGPADARRWDASILMQRTLDVYVAP